MLNCQITKRLMVRTCRRYTTRFLYKARAIEQKFIGDPTIHGCEKGMNTVAGVTSVRRKENGRRLWERNKFAMPLSSLAILLCPWNLANGAGSPLPIKYLLLFLSSSLLFIPCLPFRFLSD